MLSASKRAILAFLKSFLSSVSSNLVPKPLWIMSVCEQTGQTLGTGSVWPQVWQTNLKLSL